MCLVYMIVGAALLVLETALAQWLFSCFGFQFSFFKTLLILIVIDLLFGFFRSSGK